MPKSINVTGLCLPLLGECLNLWAAGEQLRLQRQTNRLAWDNFEFSFQWKVLFENYKKQDASIGAVYFIADKEDQLVKIGYSKNLWRRYVGLNESNPGLRIVLAVPVYHEHLRRIEDIFHRTFPGNRIHGEWFKKRDESGDYLADLVGVFIRSFPGYMPNPKGGPNGT